MAKKKRVASRSRSVSRSAGVSQSQLKRNLDRLDRDLVKALNERAKLVQRLARQLASEGASEDGRFASDDATYQQVSQLSKGPLDADALRAIFREIVSASRALVRPQRVAYLGPQYSYSYLATVERFGSSITLAPVGTIAAVFDEVNCGHVDYGVVPLENSTDGRVVDTLTMFAKLPVHICGEVQLRIHHCLMARCPRSEIQEVYSKPQAISQCREWLARHLPWVRTVEITSTAAAAQLAAGKQGAAAVASRVAAASYGLDVVAENIEDNKNNITRFAVIGGEPAARTGKDKTALMFEIPHQPGALADVMSVFKRAGLNLTWIESFPLLGSENEYLFFVELQGHESEAAVKRALTALERRTLRLVVLGSYAIAKPLD